MQNRMVDLEGYRAAAGEKNCIERNQGSNLLGGSFSNRNNVRAEI